MWDFLLRHLGGCRREEVDGAGYRCKADFFIALNDTIHSNPYTGVVCGSAGEEGILCSWLEIAGSNPIAGRLMSLLEGGV